MNKPKCKLAGKDGNVFNLIAICKSVLDDNGMSKEGTEMCNRIYKSKSYIEALQIMGEYVDIE